jgi:hypothetical protein
MVNGRFANLIITNTFLDSPVRTADMQRNYFEFNSSCPLSFPFVKPIELSREAFFINEETERDFITAEVGP